jgi:ADP-ribose pyrophosphatase
MKKIIPEDSILLPNDAKCVFKGMIFDTYQWEQELFDGSHHTFEMLKRTDTVQAICIVEDQIIVLEDEQPHLGTRDSFPGGRVDDEDQSIQAAAEREVLEETGYSFKKWRLISVEQPYRKMEWFIHIFVAWDVKDQIAPQFDAGEKITLAKLEFDTVKQNGPQRFGYLGGTFSVFKDVNSLDELTQLPEFVGQTVDR